MKRLLPYLMKMHLPSLRSISKLLIICFVAIAFMGSCTRKSDNQLSDFDDVDEVFVLSIDPQIQTTCNITKYDFVRIYKTDSSHKINILKNEEAKDIARRLMEVTNPSFAQNERYTHEEFYYKPIVMPDGRFYLLDTYPLDVRTLMLLGNHGRYTPVWISSTQMELNNYIYKTPRSLNEYIEKIRMSQQND